MEGTVGRARVCYHELVSRRNIVGVQNIKERSLRGESTWVKGMVTGDGRLTEELGVFRRELVRGRSIVGIQDVRERCLQGESIRMKRMVTGNGGDSRKSKDVLSCSSKRKKHCRKSRYKRKKFTLGKYEDERNGNGRWKQLRAIMLCHELVRVWSVEGFKDITKRDLKGDSTRMKRLQIREMGRLTEELGCFVMN